MATIAAMVWVARGWKVGGRAPSVPRVGVLSLTGPDLADSFRSDKSLKFLNNSAEVMPKVRRTREEIDRRSLPVAIEVDGGIDEDTAPVAAAAGATVFVAGSAIFGDEHPAEAARRIRMAADRAGREPSTTGG